MGQLARLHQRVHDGVGLKSIKKCIQAVEAWSFRIGLRCTSFLKEEEKVGGLRKH